MITDKEARRASAVLYKYCRERVGDQKPSPTDKDNGCHDCIFYWKSPLDEKHYCAFTVWWVADALADVCGVDANKGTKAPVHTDNDVVNHPQHYCRGGIETVDIIKAKMPITWFWGYLMGNILKYVTRANYKGSQTEDLKKAAWYLDRLITELEKDKDS